ncbi:MAG: transposase, partial [Terriglobales bacterium]
PVVAALDDTLCKKTGRHIPGTTYARDPLSPPFHVNLVRGLRFVQASLLVRATQFLGPARALPVRFEPAPPAVKPPSIQSAHKHTRKNQRKQKKKQKRNAEKKIGAPAGKKKVAPTLEEEEYRLQKKLRALTQVGVRVLQSLRQSLDARSDTRQRQLLVSGDGSYTNRTVLRQLPERTTFIGRIRKDAKLFQPLPPASATRSGGRPRRYGALAPTPEQLLHDDAVPVVKVRCFAAGEVREIPVKLLRTVYWRKSGADMPLLLVVIKPLGYRLRKGSKLLYRQPAFLICTDPLLDLQILLQAYIDRWEIECNHRDEKSFIGVAQGQVWNPLAVTRLPQFQVAIYSLLLLASILAYGFERAAVYLPLPLWRRKSIRPSVLDLLNLLRDQIFARQMQDEATPSIDDFAILPPVDANASKPPLGSETLCTVAA